MAYLGNVSQITIGTSDLSESIAFYQKMGFRIVNQHTEPNPWAQITDDTILILLNQDNMDYIGFTYFNPQMADIVVKLKAAGVPFIMEIENVQVIFSSPSGFWISLINYDASNMFQPAGKTLADIPQDDWSNAPAPNPNLGIFGELAIPVEDLDAEIACWEMIGFEVTKFEGPYPWAIGQDGQNIIGLHHTTEFDKSAITFFAKDMDDKVRTLKSTGLDSFEDFGGTGGNNEANQVLKTPEGQRFFLFSF